MLVLLIAGCGLEEVFEDDDSASQGPSNDEIAAAVAAPKPASTSEVAGAGVHCYDRYETLKKIVQKSSSPIPGTHQWHHVVNQNPPTRSASAGACTAPTT